MESRRPVRVQPVTLYPQSEKDSTRRPVCLLRERLDTPHLPGTSGFGGRSGSGASRNPWHRVSVYASLRMTRGVSHQTSCPGDLGGNSLNLSRQQPPFLNVRLAWRPAPISLAARSERSGS